MTPLNQNKGTMTSRQEDAMGESTDLGQNGDSLRLRRLEWNGHSRYQTRDGRFTIEQGGNGAGSWTIYPSGDTAAAREDDAIVLTVAGADRAFNTLREAREWLAGSVYGSPHGWLWQPARVIRAEYRRMTFEPVSD